MTERRIANLEEFGTFVREFAVGLKPRERATVLALNGNLGAGKTTFTQTLARELGITETVTSPTFVIQKRYKTAAGPFAQLIHIDAYRLDSADELRALDWDVLVADPANIICLEWPERVAEIVPADAIAINLEIADGGGRTISL